MATILLVEDDRSVQQTLTTFAQGRGHDAFVAGDGRKGLRLYETIAPDPVLLDIMLAEKDGIEMSRELLRAHPDTVVIGYTLGEDYFKLLRAYGVRRCFSKPLSFKRLAEAMEAELAGRSSGPHGDVGPEGSTIARRSRITPGT